MEKPNAESDFYRLPEFYDILHTPGTRSEVSGLLRLARRHQPGAVPREGARRPVWLEPFCGTGRYLRELAARGCRGIGVDAAKDMIEYGRAALKAVSVERRRVRLVCADVTRRVGGIADRSVDLAFCPINSIRHLPSDRAMLGHLKEVARVLRPGGVYAVGIGLSSYTAEFETEDVWEASRRGTKVRQVVQYIPPTAGEGPEARRERCISHLTVSSRTGSREIDFAYDLRSYDLGEWRALIERSAMEIAGVCDESGRPIEAAEPGYAVFLLRPRSRGRRR